MLLLHFNPRLPCGRRPSAVLSVRLQTKRFQSTPSVWKATSPAGDSNRKGKRISIHAFRVEGDYLLTELFYHFQLFQSTPSVWKATKISQEGLNTAQISIHAFRVEGDLDVSTLFCPLGLFQSTPSVWKATTDFSLGSPNWAHFNPRLPCGRRP